MRFSTCMQASKRSFRGAIGAVFLLCGIAMLLAQACSAGKDSSFDDEGATTTAGQGGFGGGLTVGVGGQAGGQVGDPKTCEEAQTMKTYIGCDFWPTVNFNNVWSIFDFAAVVANAGENVVDVTVERNGMTVATAQIQPDSLERIYLPWVPELKGPDFGNTTNVAPPTGSVRSTGGAYHLIASYPVTVYQFNALEFGPQGGPPGKNWAACPALVPIVECYSYSNDASLLIPSTAWTPNYRVTSINGWQLANMGTHIAITGLTDGTMVTVNLSPTGEVIAGNGVSAIGIGGTSSFTINRGEVVQLLGTATADLSGSLITASQAIQVIAGHPCRYVPDNDSACDHLEETVLPAETLGQRYFVTRPTGPNGDAPGHVVRIHGNFDGTALSYPSGQPPGAPGTINAGDVVDLGVVNVDFEIQGDQSFAVASFQLAGSIVDPGDPMLANGDPAQSQAIAVEQYRLKYVFLAPSDYTMSFVDVIMPTGATVTLDGSAVTVAATAIGSSGHGVARVPLSNSGSGAHVLEATAPVGIQVSGYGLYTSYYYPGGLDLQAISPPPPPQ